MKFLRIAALLCVPLLMAGSAHNSFVYPPCAHPFGQSQEQWSANWWTWFMELPADANHPAYDTSDIASVQSGNVWFLNAWFEPDSVSSSQRSITVPKGKSIFVPLVNGEWSSNEGFPTEQDQRLAAIDQANHILPSSLFCTLDGQSVNNPGNYRFESPQFNFTAPDPWIFSPAPSGAGTAVADGYFVFLKKLKRGHHTLHFGGQAHYAVAEGDGFDWDGYINFTYNITQL